MIILYILYLDLVVFLILFSSIKIISALIFKNSDINVNT